MPRFVRNFWLSGTVDGVASGIKGTGPKSADGGFDLTILVREDGAISDRKMHITGRVIDGKCVVTAMVDGQDDLKLTTER